ncbi:MAG: hypothetical protein ACR2PG_18680 [Hyphomicrobiaceae bacterium]
MIVVVAFVPTLYGGLGSRTQTVRLQCKQTVFWSAGPQTPPACQPAPVPLPLLVPEPSLVSLLLATAATAFRADKKMGGKITSRQEAAHFSSNMRAAVAQKMGNTALLAGAAGQISQSFQHMA